MQIKSTLLATAMAVLALGAAAQAQAASNLGFETGDASGWAVSGHGGATTGYGAFGAIEGAYLGYIEAGLGSGVYSTLTQVFDLVAGQTISGQVGFQANDYWPFNDDAYLTINGVHLFDSSVGAVGSYGDSGWQAFTYTAPTTGAYALQLGVRNDGDNAASSGAVIDKVGLSAAVPEPAGWAMMILGFGAIGLLLRSDRRRVTVAA